MHRNTMVEQINIGFIKKELTALFNTALDDIEEELKNGSIEFSDDSSIGDDGTNTLSVEIHVENKDDGIDSQYTDFYRKHQLYGNCDNVPYDKDNSVPEGGGGDDDFHSKENRGSNRIAAPKKTTKRYIFKLKDPQITNMEMDIMAKKISDNQVIVMRDTDFDLIELDLVE